MNINTEYERFTQEIYQQLSQATKVNAADVQHNVKLEGRSGQKHQIDVYWEYEKDGKKHRVAIECKNYSRRISLEKVCAFRGVLDDLDGVSGIMVSKVGFQKGAKKYAQQFGISLKELRSPRYGETVIGEIENHISISTHYTLFWIDEDWAKQHNFDIEIYRKRLAQLFISRTEYWDSPPYIHIEKKDDILQDSLGNKITSIAEIEKTISDHPTEDYPFIFKYDDAYLDSLYFGPIKIRAVKFDHNIHDHHHTIVLDAGDLVKAILKDSHRDETDFVSLG